MTFEHLTDEYRAKIAEYLSLVYGDNQKLSDIIRKAERFIGRILEKRQLTDSQLYSLLSGHVDMIDLDLYDTFLPVSSVDDDNLNPNKILILKGDEDGNAPLEEIISKLGKVLSIEDLSFIISNVKDEHEIKKGIEFIETVGTNLIDRNYRRRTSVFIDEELGTKWQYLAFLARKKQGEKLRGYAVPVDFSRKSQRILVTNIALQDISKRFNIGIEDFYKFKQIIGHSLDRLMRCEYGLVRGLDEKHGVKALVTEAYPSLEEKYFYTNTNRKYTDDFILKKMESILYSIPGFKEANREKQIQLIEKYIRDYMSNGKRSPFRFFLDRGIPSLDRLAWFPEVEEQNCYGYLKFYSDKNNLNWFYRTQKVYLKRWQYMHNFLWKSEEADKLVLEATEDILWLIPTFKEADPDMQWKLIERDVFHAYEERGGLMQWLKRNYLWGMAQAYEGFDKQSSGRAVLKNYSDKKGLNWNSPLLKYKAD